jgi:hypothetical protein
MIDNDDILRQIYIHMSGKVEKGEHVYLIRSNSFQLRIITYIYKYICVYEI